MKKLRLLSAILAAGTLLGASLAMPVSAGLTQKGTPDASKLPEGTLIYEETFDGLKSSDTAEILDTLGWTLAEGLTKSTMKMSAADGKLTVDNLDASSVDSYALMMDSDYLAKVCNQDYTYEYDITYLDAGNTTRYFSILCNYDGKDNYNTVDMRINGNGYNQTRRASSWIHYNDTTCPIRATDKTAIITQLFGETYDANAMHLKGKTITVRVETSIKNGPTVYVNDIMVSDMKANTDKWQTIDSFAMCFKASKLVKFDIDNIRVWTGLADEPIAPAVVSAPATADAASAALFVAVASAAAVVVLKKRK